MQSPSTPSVAPPRAWNARYEIKAVGLLTLGMGLLGLDRFIINPLFPVMQKDLGLGYQDLGFISAALALSWGIAAICAGGVSDRIGRKKVIVPALVFFSLMVATSGLAGGLISLMVIRALMGFAEGAYLPASVVATVEASKPSRIGLNVGIQQMAQPLFGLGFGPLIVVGLLKVVPSWHWVFGVVAVPGLLLALLMARVLRDDAPAAVPKVAEESRIGEVLRSPAVLVNTLCMFCYLTSVVTLSAFMPNYLTDHLRLSLDQMGGVMAGLGVGGLVGMVLVPALSDRLGHKPVLLVSLVINALALWHLPSIGAEPVALFATLCVAVAMNSGVVAITVGPLTSAAVPARLSATATGLVIGLGEIVGGALAPAVAGALAQRAGITIVPQMSLMAILVALVLVALGVRKPRAPIGASRGMARGPRSSA